MHAPELPYATSLALLTDLYQLTMAQAYLHHGSAEHEAVFHLYFRKPPYGGGYTVSAGLGTAAAWLSSLRYDRADLDYLATLTGNDGAPLFRPDFLDWLGALRLRCDIDAMPEGTLAWAQEPLVRVRGPLAQCQLLETALLTILNFQTLIATKAARVVHAAGGGPVLEFGLRRAQGPDGGLSASRAAYVGGCAATSNVLAGRLLGIPVRGTHAHSWVMSFDDERAAFAAYADAQPNNATLLVDTYDTLEGVRRAIEVGRTLRARGHRLAGIRLDSGDLAALSIEARRLLDEGGFPDAVIVASNDLDEHLVASLRQQGARIDAWGVGTRLATGGEQAALGGVYKLAAIRPGPGQPWSWRVKLSENPVKISTPGVLQVRRFEEAGQYAGDVIWNEAGELPGERPAGPAPASPRRWDAVHVDDALHTFTLTGEGRDLLVPLFRGGERVSGPEPLEVVRARVQAGLAALRPGQLRFDNPAKYLVGYAEDLYREKAALVRRARG